MGVVMKLYFNKPSPYARKVRIVAWQTSNGVYWVSNTLNQALSTDQMIGIARSLRRLGQK